MKKIIPILGLLALAALAYYFGAFRGARRAEIRLSGNIEATTVDLSFQTMGRIDILEVEEGQLVKKGQRIASLDSTELRQREVNAVTRLASVESQIPPLQTSIRLQRETVRTEIQRADAGLAAAQAQFDELRHGARPQEREQARQALAAARSRLDNARLEWERARQLTAAGAQPQRVLDSAQMVLDTAAAEQKRASEYLTLVEEGARREVLDAAEARLRQARVVLDQARLGELTVTRMEQQLRSLETEVENARSSLAIARTQLGYAELLAPISGRIISKSTEQGEMISVGAPVLSMADLEDIWLRVYLDAVDLGKVRLEQAVTVTTDSFPLKKYQGTISFVSSEAEFTPKTIQTEKERVKLVYRLKIRIRNENQELKPGMPADAVIPL